MSMLQHYYTSCAHGTSGHSGFQIKAMSPGISAEELKTINSLISYRIPPSQDENDIAGHPIALRYNMLGSKKCLLVCCQSNGKDENGRSGNFFAHTILTSSTDFDLFPPIMYWRHPFWRKTDPVNRLEIPVREKFDEHPSLDFEQIFPFLSQGNRQDWFLKLLSAVIHYPETQRPIIILDDINHVALWVAAVTFALPGMFRHLLTFATYHHNPYQSPLLVTGTTHDSKFRFSADEYISYFILNAESQRISDVADSVYARHVCKYFERHVYEKKLLDLFQFIDDRKLPTTLRYLTYLDQITIQYQTLRERTLQPDLPEVQRSLASFLQETKGKQVLSSENLADLVTTADMLRETISRQMTAGQTIGIDRLKDYSLALKLLKQHDQAYLIRHCSADLALAVQSIQYGDESILELLLTLLEEIYSTPTLAQAANRDTFIHNLTRDGALNDVNSNFLLWKYIGPLFFLNTRPSNKLAILIQHALAVLDQLPVTDRRTAPPAANKVLAAIIAGVQDKQKFILECALVWHKQNPSGNAFAWLYYGIVGDLSLSDRQPYRRLLSSSKLDSATYNELLSLELEADISSSRPGDMVPLLEGWCKHMMAETAVQSQIISQGLDQIWGEVSQQQKGELAERLLTSELLSERLPPNWKEELLNFYLSGLSLKKLDQRTVQLYMQLLRQSQLDANQRALLQASIAISTGQFPAVSMTHLMNWFFALDEVTYKRAVEKFLNCFFVGDFVLSEHIKMLQVMYVQHRDDIFWELYWSFFKAYLLNRSRVSKIVELLSFWFEESIELLRDKPFLIPAFFLDLPTVLDEVKVEKEFKRVAPLFAAQAEVRQWYPLVSRHFVREKRLGFFRFGKK